MNNKIALFFLVATASLATQPIMGVFGDPNGWGRGVRTPNNNRNNTSGVASSVAKKDNNNDGNNGTATEAISAKRPSFTGKDASAVEGRVDGKDGNRTDDVKRLAEQGESTSTDQGWSTTTKVGVTGAVLVVIAGVIYYLKPFRGGSQSSRG